MSTTTLYLEGTLKWAKLYPGQEDTKYGKKASVDLYPTEVSQLAFETSGSRLKARHDDEGQLYYTFARKIDDINPLTKEPFGYPKVVITGKDDEVPLPFSESIGNGTRAVLKVVVYDTARYGKGTRLEGVNILEHVPYARNTEQESPYRF